MKRGYTTIEQSKRLLELGLDISTSDMYYRTTINGIARTADKPTIGSAITEWDIPCWSLSALLDVLPKIDGLKPILDLEECSIEYSGINLYITASNPIDACVVMIEMLHELNLL